MKKISVVASVAVAMSLSAAAAERWNMFERRLRETTINWSDEYHHREAVQKKEAEQVATSVLSAHEGASK